MPGASTVLIPWGPEAPAGPTAQRRYHVCVGVHLELPEDLFSALRRSPDEFVQEMRLAAATHWYERGQVSQEKAAQIAGLDRTDFLAALAREEVDVFSVDREDLKRELERG